MSEEVAAVATDELHPLDPAAEQEPTPETPEVEQEAEGEEGEAKKESKQYTQEEVDRIVKKAKRNASYLARKEAEAELYRQQVERGTQRAPEPEQKDAAPKREDFDDYETYLEARADYRADQKVKAVLSEQQARQQQQTQQTSETQRFARFQQALDKARSEIADFDDVVGEADVPVSQTMRDAILESDVGALLTYHLAKNPAEAERIARLSPIAQAKAIGQIEATLATKPAPRVSKAPAPIKPISGASGGHADPSKMSMEEYKAWRAKAGAPWARR